MCGKTEEPIKIKIDGELFQVEPGFTVLEVCRQFGFDVPTLCFDEALTPYAACRLCVVEVSNKGPKRTVASCVYPAEDGLEVATSSDDIVRHRRNLVELYLARSPKARRIRELAEELGVREPRYKFEETNNCILCGRCIRACEQIVRASAIGFEKRGIRRSVEPPFRRGSAACISCGTCTTICPTEAIRLEQIDRVKSVHTFPAGSHEAGCRVCGSFEMVPGVPDDYGDWLSEEVVAPAKGKRGETQK